MILCVGGVKTRLGEVEINFWASSYENVNIVKEFDHKTLRARNIKFQKK
jgi:hypothetical protein